MIISRSIASEHFEDSYQVLWGFPGDSVGKESTCSEGGLGSIPGLGRYPGERKGHPLQYSVLEKSTDTVHGVAKSWTQLSDFHFHWQETQETWFRSLGWKDPLEKEMATHSSILAWKIPWTKEPGGLQSMGSQRIRTE